MNGNSGPTKTSLIGDTMAETTAFQAKGESVPKNEPGGWSKNMVVTKRNAKGPITKRETNFILDVLIPGFSKLALYSFKLVHIPKNQHTKLINGHIPVNNKIWAATIMRCAGKIICGYFRLPNSLLLSLDHFSGKTWTTTFDPLHANAEMRMHSDQCLVVVMIQTCR